RSQQLLRRIKRKKFNPYQLSESELITSCKIIFEDTFRQIGVPIIPGRLEKFILVTKSSYLENDYHNFCHAVDVLQATYLFLTSMGLKHISDPNVPCSIHLLSTKHITALLVAALGHDVGHPGVNNSFLIKTGIPLASMYSNVAVLEKFHALALVNLIHSQDCLFFPDLFSDLSEFYSLISDIIIATDMAAHFDHLKRIQDLGERRKFSDYKINEKDSLIILSALIKCSDLINVTRPFDIAKDWTRCLTEELHKQCCMELALGIDPQLPLDQLRGPQNASQVSFIQNMALPLFDCTADLLSELSLFPQQLQSNLSLWKHL
ncbi:HD-domain/PDEase-like protein, partial [Neoconidiobolus thromboides FSU 785]